MENPSPALQSLREHDRLCDEFERNFQFHGSSQLREMLLQAKEDQRTGLCEALVAIEIELLASHSVYPTLDEYLKRVGIKKGKTISASYENAVGLLPASTRIQFSNSRFENEFPSAAKLLNERGIEVGQKLGQGGMGLVYQGVQTTFDRPVAIKILPGQLVSSQNSRDRFQREIQALGKLNHPQIVQAYDAALDCDEPFLVMEFVEGLNLSEIIAANGPLSLSHACEIIRQVASGVYHAHRHGIIHRDIKPSNLMLQSSGSVYILDFGLARLWREQESNQELTQTGMVFGSIHFMAPEQFRDSHNVQESADQYSLGCVFYYLLTGEKPFGENTVDPYVLLNAHQNEQPKPIDQFRKDVPAEVVTIVQKMMSKSVPERYANMDHIANALAPYSEASSLSALIRSPLQTPPQSESDTNDQSMQVTLTHPYPGIRTKDKQARKKPVSIRWLLTGGAILALLILSSVIIYIKTNFGTLRLEVDDPKIQVRIDGNEITVDNAGKILKLRAGKKTIHITSDELNIDVKKEFTLRRSDRRRILHVVLLETGEIKLGEGAIPSSAKGKPSDKIGPKPVPRNTIVKNKEHRDPENSKQPNGNRSTSPRLAKVESKAIKSTSGQFTGLEFFMPGFDKTELTAINQMGIAAGIGYSEDNKIAPDYFLVEKGRIESSGSGRVFSINADRRLAGQSHHVTPENILVRQATVFDKGMPRILGTLSKESNRISRGLDLNQNGDVVGWTDGDEASYRIAFLHSQDNLKQLSPNESCANAINDQGMITGWVRFKTGAPSNGFIYQDGKMKILDKLFADGASEGNDINAGGFVCGWSYLRAESSAHAVLWDPQQRIRDLGTLGGDKSSANGVNDQGWVVGWSRMIPGNDRDTHAFLWDGQEMTDIHPDGWKHSVAEKINNDGWIVGHGINPSGQRCGFLMQPIGPIPRLSITSIQKEIATGIPSDPGSDQVAEWRRELQSLAIEKGLGKKSGELAALLPSFADLLSRSDASEYEKSIAGQQLETNSQVGLVAILGDSRLNHWKGVYTISTHEADRRIVTGGHDFHLRMWNQETFQQVWQANHGEFIHHVAYGKLGQVVASAGNEGTIKIWDAKTGRLKITLKDQEHSVRRLAFFNRDKGLISVGYDGRIRFWDWNKKEVLDSLMEHKGLVAGMDLSPDEKTLVTAGDDRTIRVWDLTKGKVIAMMNGHTARIQTVALIPNRSQVISGSKDGTARIWDYETEKEIRKLDVGKEDVDAVAVNLDGSIVATAGGSNSLNIALWNPEDGKQIGSLGRHFHDIDELRFSEDGSRLYAASLAGSIHIWDVLNRKEITKDVSTAGFRDADIHPNGDRVVATSIDSNTYQADLNQKGTLIALNDHYSIGQSVRFNHDGNRFASGASDGTLAVRDRSGKLIWKRRLGMGRIRCVSFHPKQKFVAVSGDQPFVIQLLDTTDGRHLNTIQGLDEEARGLEFSPDGSLLAAGTMKGSVHLFRSSDQELVQSIHESNQSVESISFSPDGDQLAVAGTQSVTIRSVPHLRLLKNLSWQDEKVPEVKYLASGIDYSANGKLLATSGWDGYLRIWNCNDWQLKHQIRIAAPNCWSRRVRFFPDSRHVLTANENGTLYVFRLSGPPKK